MLHEATEVLRERLLGDGGTAAGGGETTAAAVVDGRSLLNMPVARAVAVAGGAEPALQHLRSLERAVKARASAAGDDASGELGRIKTRKARVKAFRVKPGAAQPTTQPTTQPAAQ